MVKQKKNDVFDDIEVILDELLTSIESTDSNIINLYGKWSVGDIINAKEAMKRQGALQFRHLFLDCYLLQDRFCHHEFP